MVLAAALLALTVVLAYSNGANDVSKGIATLAGAGLSKYRTAIVWGSVCTVAGAIAAGFVSQSLVRTFSGKGLVSGSVLPPAFLLAVACGAVAWLTVATMTGLPVSTTHSLAGALIGAAVIATGTDGVMWPAVMKSVALPLIASPLVSLVLVIILAPLLQPLGRRFSRYCLCLEQNATSLATTNGAAFQETAPAVRTGDSAACSTSVVRLGAVDAFHWVSAGSTSFFRGMNDAPKVLAIGVAASAVAGVSTTTLYAAVAGAMGAGSLIAGLRVTRTLAEKVTPMTPMDGFTANLVTSILVATATRFALPVSTTHVSSSAIVGAGIARGRGDVRWKTVREMLLAWVVTVPVSAACAALVFWLMSETA